VASVRQAVHPDAVQPGTDNDGTKSSQMPLPVLIGIVVGSVLGVAALVGIGYVAFYREEVFNRCGRNARMEKIQESRKKRLGSGNPHSESGSDLLMSQNPMAFQKKGSKVKMASSSKPDSLSSIASMSRITSSTNPLRAGKKSQSAASKGGITRKPIPPKNSASVQEKPSPKKNLHRPSDSSNSVNPLLDMKRSESRGRKDLSQLDSDSFGVANPMASLRKVGRRPSFRTLGGRKDEEGEAAPAASDTTSAASKKPAELGLVGGAANLAKRKLSRSGSRRDSMSPSTTGNPLAQATARRGSSAGGKSVERLRRPTKIGRSLGSAAKKKSGGHK